MTQVVEILLCVPCIINTVATDALVTQGTGGISSHGTCMDEVILEYFGFRTTSVSLLILEQNGWHFADNSFKYILLNDIVSIPNEILLKCVPDSLIDNKSTLVQVVACHLTGDKPLLEPMLTKIYDALWCYSAPMS